MNEITVYRLAAHVLERLSTAYEDALGDIVYLLKESEEGWGERSKAWGKACSDLVSILPQIRKALDTRNTNLGLDSSGFEVFFDPNGSTLVFNEKGEQVGQAQGGWVTVFAEFLAMKGLEPKKMTFTLPTGARARIIDGEFGFSWEVLEDKPKEQVEESGHGEEGEVESLGS